MLTDLHETPDVWNRLATQCAIETQTTALWAILVPLLRFPLPDFKETCNSELLWLKHGRADADDLISSPYCEWSDLVWLACAARLVHIKVLLSTGSAVESSR